VELRTLRDAELYLDGFVNLERRTGFDYARLGTERVRALLEALGHPERGLPCVHITGSKGKGSVALMTEALLLAAGARVGTFTSPHLESWCERFRIGGREAGARELLRALRTLAPAAERQRRDSALRPSFFDVATALALLLFREAGVDGAIVEVGLGGRLDSTNVVESSVSVLTSIELEHTDKLGGTVGAIASEKAGILRPGIPVLHGSLPPEALGVLLAQAVALDAPVEEVTPTDVDLGPGGVRFRLSDGRRLAVGALGAHQARNAALAVRAAERWLGRALEGGELDALRELRLPARLEPIGDAILDCAHTLESARALRMTLEALHPGRRWIVVLAISADKDAAGILKEIAPATRAAVLCRADPVRSRPPESLDPLVRACGIQSIVEPDPRAALERARSEQAPGELLVVTGSFYLAAALRPILRAAEERGRTQTG
jgi:dihydrofolate synthase/folylpolyglutamate synthase